MCFKARRIKKNNGETGKSGKSGHSSNGGKIAESDSSGKGEPAPVMRKRKTGGDGGGLVDTTPPVVPKLAKTVVGPALGVSINTMNYGRFKEKANIVSHRIRWGPEAVSNAVVEGTPAEIDKLTSPERVYVRLFSYRFRSKDLLPACFKCLGFRSHAKNHVHVHSSQIDHMTSFRSQTVHCWNCTFRPLAVHYLRHKGN